MIEGGNRPDGSAPGPFDHLSDCHRPRQRRPGAASKTRAQWLKRVFGIDIETCPAGGDLLTREAMIEAGITTQGGLKAI